MFDLSQQHSSCARQCFICATCDVAAQDIWSAVKAQLIAYFRSGTPVVPGDGTLCDDVNFFKLVRSPLPTQAKATSLALPSCQHVPFRRLRFSAR